MAGKRRGRPKSTGTPGWVLQRDCIALKAFDESRAAGDKYEAALREMVKAVKCWDSLLRMSITEAKRILARWRRDDRPSTLLAGEQQILTGESAAPYLDKMNDLQQQFANLRKMPQPAKLTGGSVKIVPFGIGSLPRYKRINSKET